MKIQDRGDRKGIFFLVSASPEGGARFGGASLWRPRSSRRSGSKIELRSAAVLSGRELLVAPASGPLRRWWIAMSFRSRHQPLGQQDRRHPRLQLD
jgi:hypothetical protein